MSVMGANYNAVKTHMCVLQLESRSKVLLRLSREINTSQKLPGLVVFGRDSN